jgi:hypothetical protein
LRRDGIETPYGFPAAANLLVSAPLGVQADLLKSAKVAAGVLQYQYLQ